MEVNVKYRKDEETLLNDLTIYRRLVGSLIYLTTIRPDISYAVHKVSQFMASPRHLHLAVVQRIIRYLRNSLARGLFFPTGSALHLVAYSDADWVGCPDTRCSTTDNTSVIQIATNPVFRERTKHIEVDCHSIRDTWSAG
ncbi:uncharacterized mitochondrial protein AtMg00240-like [Aristolochia californica]|uniref:uncharacterized mitochondrial protein AtMg00240-like n=1 Tax=Aristolochia californica TaxID=171875 RepID=UPI0035DBEB7A